MNNKSKNIGISLFFFIFSVGCVITFILLDFLFFSYNTKSKLLDNAIEISKQKEQQFLDSVLTTESILLSIRKSESFINYMNNQKKYNKNINDIFLMFTKQDKNIMQLRYIDKNGQEKIRIDRDNLNDSAFIVKDENLQNKSMRYYFKDSISQNEKVRYSNLDLNIEYNKIEKPYKPTLRAVLPIKNAGKFDGILLINYQMKRILNTISKTPSHDIILFNEQGYPLIHYNENNNWGFYQDKKISIKEDVGNYYDEVINTQSIFKNSDFIVKKINFELPNKLYLYVKLNDNYISSLLNDRYLHYFSVSFIILLLSLLMSTIFSKYLRKIFLVLKDSKTLNRLLNEKVKEQTKEINESKQQLNDIITTINDFIWEINHKGEFTYLSPQVESILGYKPEELIGKTPFNLMPEKKRAYVKKLFFNMIENAQPINQLRNKSIHRNGHLVYLETSANPILDINGKVTGYRGSDRDITQKVNAQKIINENYRKIEELNENLEYQINEEVEKNKEKDMQLFAQSKLAAMGDMIANIAHQWRQPLSTISTIASGVKIKEEVGLTNGEDLIRDMNNIVDKTQHLSKTIDTFMNFVKDEKQIDNKSIKSIIQNSIDMVDSALSNHFINLSTNFHLFEDFHISTVATELQEVLINILNNAKDALSQNDISNKKIDIELLREKSHFSIRIEDNGGGISKDVIDRVFEPYFTTKHASQGTGLGLHMSYRIITESLGGNIFASNGKDGAVFTIVLPLKVNN